MATASIRIDQSTHTTTPIGVVGRARDDIEISEQVTLRNGDDSGVSSWRWVMLARPAASTATLSNPIAASCTFTPDVVGTYRVRLTVNDGNVGEIATTVAVVRDADGLRIPAFGETIEANWLIGGSPNEQGWQPDFEAYLAFLKDGLSVAGAPTTVVDIDFTDVGTGTISDGANVIGGLTWTASNIATRTTLAEWDDTGINMLHVTGSSSQITSADTAPRISIALEDLIPNYDPTRRYFFCVEFDWQPAPNENGERFSVGFFGEGAAPWPSSSERFAGVTSTYNSSPAAPTVSGERNNTILNTQSPDAPVIAISLDGITEVSMWKAPSLPASPSSLVPVLGQRASNLTNGGDYNTFNHPSSNTFVMALAATGATATHGVAITALRIFRS